MASAFKGYRIFLLKKLDAKNWSNNYMDGVQVYWINMVKKNSFTENQVVTAFKGIIYPYQNLNIKNMIPKRTGAHKWFNNGSYKLRTTL